MIELHASLAAQQVTRSAALSALPNAPIVADDAPIVQRAGVIAARQRLSEGLRRLADLVQPLGSGTALPLPAPR